MIFTRRKFSIIAYINEQIEDLHEEAEKEGYISLKILDLYDYYLCQRRMIAGLNPNDWSKCIYSNKFKKCLKILLNKISFI